MSTSPLSLSLEIVPRSKAGLPQYNTDSLGSVEIVRDERRIANNLAYFCGANLESPLTLIGIREGGVTVGSAQDDERAASQVEDLAAGLLVLNRLANFQLNGVVEDPEASSDGEGAAGGKRIVVNRAEGGVGEFGVQLEVGGAGFREAGVALNAGDGVERTELPRTTATVGEGDVGVLASVHDDGHARFIEKLAAEVLLFKVRSQ